MRISKVGVKMGHHMEDQGVQLQKEQMLKKEVIIAKKM